MEHIEQIKQLIGEAKNICVIPEEDSNPEAVTSALSLFYTLKNLGKNVNLIIENLPENLNFLTPSLDFISYPRNFVISVPNEKADISQIYYEKNDDALKIHLTIENGFLKQDDISFYFSETKPDLIITLGIKDYQSQLTGKLNSFGFLLDSPIINIDNSQSNKNFGKINLIKDASLAEMIFELIKNITDTDSLQKESAECLLAGLVIYTENFKNNITAEIFGMASQLIKTGVDFKKIISNICN